LVCCACPVPQALEFKVVLFLPCSSIFQNQKNYVIDCPSASSSVMAALLAAAKSHQGLNP